MKSLIAATVAALLAFTAPGPGVQLRARTALFLSGTQACITAPSTCLPLAVPTPEQMQATLPELFGDDELIGVPIPAQFRPFTGAESLTWDASVADGAGRLLAAIRATPGARVVFGVSQSATIVAEVKRALLVDPASPPPSELSFVVEGNPNRPNGGIAARFPGVSIPFLAVTSTGAAPDTPYDTIDIARQYDPIADFPQYPLNIVATANALAGFFYLHLDYGGVDLTKVPSGNVAEVVNPLGGKTTYYLVPTPNLPLLQPLRDLGVPSSIVDPLNRALTPIVEAGYDRDPRRVGVPTPAQVLPSPSRSRAEARAEAAAAADADVPAVEDDADGGPEQRPDGPPRAGTNSTDDGAAPQRADRSDAISR